MGFKNRMSIRHKLTLLGLLVLAAVSIPYALLLMQAGRLVSAAQGELDGLGPARQLVLLVQLTQQHRGLSAAFLGGNAQVQSEREAKQAEVKRQIATLQPLMAAPWMDAGIAQTWKDAQSQWQSVQADVGSKALKAADSSARHAALIASYFSLLDKVVDRAGLTLDPDADAYFVRPAKSISKQPAGGTAPASNWRS